MTLEVVTAASDVIIEPGSLLLAAEVHQLPWKPTAAFEIPSMTLKVYRCLWKSVNEPGSLLLPLEAHQ